MIDLSRVDRWEDVGAATEFDVRKAKLVTVGARQISVVRTEDAWYAVKDICPHAGVSLHGGEVVDQGGLLGLRCPGHGWIFALETGESQAIGTEARVACYPVKVTDGRVLLGI
jgi:nitrite reductase/ring-hydroxylating ferredoxin subunit